MGEITGKSADGQWWQTVVSTDASPSGFGWANAAYVNDFNTENVPVVDAPAVPDIPPIDPGVSCLLISQSPEDGNIFKPGAAFNMTWELENTGEKSWEPGTSSLVFFAAGTDTRLSSADVVELTGTVDPGKTYNAVVGMTAPDNPGTYSETWSITEVGGATYCMFYIIIEVQE